MPTVYFIPAHVGGQLVKDPGLLLFRGLGSYRQIAFILFLMMGPHFRDLDAPLTPFDSYGRSASFLFHPKPEICPKIRKK